MTQNTGAFEALLQEEPHLSAAGRLHRQRQHRRPRPSTKRRSATPRLSGPVSPGNWTGSNPGTPSSIGPTHTFAKWFVGGKLNACLQLHRPTPHRPPQEQSRHYLGRRAGRLAGLHLPRPLPRGLQIRQRPQEPGRAEGRPCNPVPPNGSRTRHRHARLRPHRRAPQHRFRRVQRRVPPRPDRGLTIQGDDYRRRRLASRKHHPAQAERRCFRRRRHSRREGRRRQAHRP